MGFDPITGKYDDTNAGGLRTLHPGDLLMDRNASSFVYLGYYKGYIHGRRRCPSEGYLYIPVWVWEMHDYGWRKGHVTDEHVLYGPSGVLYYLNPERIISAAKYTKNPKWFEEKCFTIDLTPVWDKIQFLGTSLQRIGDRKVKSH